MGFIDDQDERFTSFVKAEEYFVDFVDQIVARSSGREIQFLADGAEELGRGEARVDDQDDLVVAA